MLLVYFHLNRGEAFRIVKKILRVVTENFNVVCDEGMVAEIDRNMMRATQFLNDYAFDGLPDPELKILPKIQIEFKPKLIARLGSKYGHTAPTQPTVLLLSAKRPCSNE